MRFLPLFRLIQTFAPHTSTRIWCETNHFSKPEKPLSFSPL
jgi:hypothetical protein